MKKVLFIIGLLLTVSTTAVMFYGCSKDKDDPKQEDPTDPSDPTNPGINDDFEIGTYNVSTGEFTNETVNFNSTFTFAIKVKSEKFKEALDAAPTGQGGTARTLAFFEAHYTLNGSDAETNLTAPANEERLTRKAGTYIFYKENYNTGKTLADGTKGVIHFQALVAEVGSSYWWTESNDAGTIAYAGGIPFAVPDPNNPGGDDDDYDYDGNLTLDKTSLKIHIGEKVMLSASFVFDAKNIANAKWTNSNSNIVKAEALGIPMQYITGLSAGTSTITIKVGNKSVSCNVTVYGALANNNGVVINGVRWANRNVATPNTFTAKAENSGMFYQWNSNIGWSSTDPITSSPAGYEWNQNWNGGGVTTWQTTNNVCPSGWHVPTVAELESLMNAPRESTRAIINEVSGSIYGSGENAIFLPDAGMRGNYGILQTNGYQLNFYWSDSALSTSSGKLLRSGDDYSMGISSYSFNTALPVRCVANNP